MSVLRNVTIVSWTKKYRYSGWNFDKRI